MHPLTEPFDHGRLSTGDGHELYWELVGAPAGLPAVFLHGGPGGGASPGSRRNFDPRWWRALVFDQRGCGRSRPLAVDHTADLRSNTTDHLVDDIEALRELVGVERWVVVGGSWGVTLGLAYAQRHPDRVLGMVLGAVTSGRVRETQWITRDMGRVFPEQWHRFCSLVPAAARDGDLAAAYARLLASPDRAVRDAAARAWCEWEDVHMSLADGYQPHLSTQPIDFQQVFARLVTHYWAHGCFLADGELLAGMPAIAHLPATLVHGRRDVSGPLDTAWELHRAWPASRLVVVEEAGHFGGRMDELFKAAIDDMATLLS